MIDALSQIASSVGAGLSWTGNEIVVEPRKSTPAHPKYEDTAGASKAEIEAKSTIALCKCGHHKNAHQPEKCFYEYNCGCEFTERVSPLYLQERDNLYPNWPAIQFASPAK